MAFPTWLAATSGQLPLAQQPNALLVTHPSTILYVGTARDFHYTAIGSSAASTNWNAQSFTTSVGQTTVGYVILDMTSTVGTASTLAPLTVSLYTNNAGAPGTAIVSTQLTSELVFNYPSHNILIPLPATGLTASSTYWIVTNAVGTVSNQFNWVKSDQVTGASTSPDGVTWTAQAYGLTYQIFDQVGGGAQIASWDDNGARWSWVGRDSLQRIQYLAEFTAGQTATGYIQGLRSFFYSNGLLTRVQ